MVPAVLAAALILDAIADLIRLTRSEVGHSTGCQIDENTARVHLTIAPVYPAQGAAARYSSRR
jgi:hypothetical protein